MAKRSARSATVDMYASTLTQSFEVPQELAKDIARITWKYRYAKYAPEDDPYVAGFLDGILATRIMIDAMDSVIRRLIDE
jgi:hypothetical protein